VALPADRAAAQVEHAALIVDPHLPPAARHLVVDRIRGAEKIAAAGAAARLAEIFGDHAVAIFVPGDPVLATAGRSVRIGVLGIPFADPEIELAIFRRGT
jgi:hypothetical protein